MPRQRIATPTSKLSAEQRHRDFARAFLKNGGNATQAAITAGYSPKTAHVQGSRLLTYARVTKLIAGAAKRATTKLDITAERVMQEVARIAFSDTRRLYRDDGTLKAPAELDDDTAAAVAGMEVEAVTTAGKKRRTTTTSKIKLWDKGQALEKAMRHLGMFEVDNQQRQVQLSLNVAVVGEK